ncbi:MAG: hypothetical protein E7559_09170 [Ruminococcaceae bacterium]|nr:hypothetical protein [Oscillospiraceae bacterium]
MSRKSADGAQRASFVVYTDWREHINRLTAEERGMLFSAMFDYIVDGTEPHISPCADMAFSFISAQLDRDSEKYETTRRKRAEAGRKGGEASAANAANASFAKQTAANQADTVTDTVTVTDTGNVTDTDTVTVTDSDYQGGCAPVSACADECDNIADDAVTDDGVDYTAVIDLFNAVCTDLPQVTKLTDKRRRAIRARLKDADCDLQRMLEVFESVQDSAFLCGRNGGWRASFDWLMTESNFLKVQEGCYRDKQPDSRSSSDTDWGISELCMLQ